VCDVAESKRIVGDPEAHHLLLYDYVEDILERRIPHRDAHLARIADGLEAGRILMAGALGDPPNGAAIVFKGMPSSSIAKWVNEDPYFKAGLITDWRIERWNVV
jgi:uncharacterized protein YciI